ncbi:hypothetical protein CPB84DRAFT_1749630 [Gymnopilus junonius]|uniref:F-box domain-containing protein n=1 Tax=Gymnopilus junonius TaxID=109634 RepID=A0A9P5TJA7_GYMJU|nr:hypothetical protein CPB84DRAFT_1749630 [Gymnopilus junonius]
MPSLTVANISTFLHSMRLGSFNLLGSKQAPINRLPNNVLAEIFLYTIVPQDSHSVPVFDEKFMSSTPVISGYNQNTPFPLSQVCRRWRSIIHNTKAMWKSIAILNPNKRHVNRTELWLSFARNHELDIMILQSESPSEEEIEVTLELLHLFGKHLQQWATVEVFFESEAARLLAAQLVELRRSPHSIMRSAIIEIQEPMQADLADNMWRSLNRIDSLKELVWATQQEEITFTPVHVFGPRIEILHLAVPIRIDRFLNTVYASLSLLELRITLEATATFSILPVTLPQLETLEVKSTNGLSAFFDLCTFPSLKSLEIDRINVSDCPSVLWMLRRSGCQLQVFIVRLPHLPAHDLASWIELDVFQALETFVVAGADVTNEVLSALTWPLSITQPFHKPPSMPKLRHLGLTHCGPTVDSDVIIRMLGSRFWPILERGIIGQIKKSREELVTAVLTVHTKTTAMTNYEEMIKNCAERTRDWSDRSLIIRQA